MNNTYTTKQWQELLGKVNYFASNKICLALQIATALEKPLLIEGPPGVGKTFLAKAAAEVLSAKLIRLQCYEGIDASQALYEYNYGKQLMYINILKEQIKDKLGAASLKESIRILDQDAPFWGTEFLVKRPVLEAIKPEDEFLRVLLIDEIDRSEREFEALLLESLSDYSISIPEFGTVIADKKPLVILTSNRTRELSDALRRRCVYLYIDYPTVDEEMQIITSSVAGAGQKFAGRIAEIINRYRNALPKHVPSVAETIDLASMILHTAGEEFSANDILSHASLFAKHKEDLKTVEKVLAS